MYNSFFIDFRVSVVDHRTGADLSQQIGSSRAALSGTEDQYFFTC